MTVLITFVLTTAAWGVAAAFLLRRVAVHLKENPEGVETVSRHVLLPIFSRRNEPKKAEGPFPFAARRAADGGRPASS